MTPPPPPPPRGRGRAGDDDLEHVLRRSRRRRDRTRGKRKRRTTLIFVVLLVIVLAVIASGVGAVARFRSDCDLKELKPVQIGENSFVYAANGSLLGAIPAERNRTPVALWRVSPWMGKATVAIEDHRFYEHGGVDYEGIARAAWKDLSAGHVVQGGSTITQQLVRNLYISKERTFKRKLKEACLAIRLSRARSKDWILGQYMNQVYYGNHAYGIEAAARDLLLEGRARPEPGASRRCSPACRRRRRSTTRCTGPGRPGSAATRCCARCATTATSTRRATCTRWRRRT